MEKFTSYPEGQAFVAKFTDALELIITFANGTKSLNRLNAMYVLRNVAFYPSNRSRLLTSGKLDLYLYIALLKKKIINYRRISQCVTIENE